MTRRDIEHLVAGSAYPDRSRGRERRMPRTKRFSDLLADGHVLNHYQPIVDLRSGQVLGLETLGRLVEGSDIIPPGVFLPSLGSAALETLLFVSLPQGLETLKACSIAHPALFMSFNVSPVVILRDGFLERLLRTLSQHGISPRRITLEILESDEFLNLSSALACLRQLRAAGISIALDDVGAGYSSLMRLRDLPVDKIKLDQSFLHKLQHQPNSLHFVAAMQSLAHGLRKPLIVEGVETPEIMDALGVMGVQAAQGYAIARPAPAEVLLEWLANRIPTPVDRSPRSLLGAYGLHLMIVEACRALSNQPLQVNWAEGVHDPHLCSIGHYFDHNGLHDTVFGQAHKRFHQVVDCYVSDPDAWERTAAALLRSLEDAIIREASPLDFIESRPVRIPAQVRRRDRTPTRCDKADKRAVDQTPQA